jgi:hypothetical protein
MGREMPQYSHRCYISRCGESRAFWSARFLWAETLSDVQLRIRVFGLGGKNHKRGGALVRLQTKKPASSGEL